MNKQAVKQTIEHNMHTGHTSSRGMKIALMVLAAAALFVLVLLLLQGAEARTITVDDDGGAEYERIQDAIDNATEGDTIRVWEGIYYENVVVNKTVNLIGNGSANTIIDGGNNERSVVSINADSVNMSGFTVTGSGGDRSHSYAGIWVYSNYIHIFENKCSNNYHGIFVYKSSNNILTNNTCSNNEDHGIYLYESGNNILTNNTYSNNNHGIHFWEASNNILTNNTCSYNDYGFFFDKRSSYNILINNICTYNDLGIYLESSSNNNNFTNNKCLYNNLYGICIFNSATNNYMNNLCSFNEIGIFLRESNKNILTNNTCSYNNRGLTNNTYSSNNRGIYLYGSSNNILTDNICLDNGYGIYLSWSSHNTLTNNTVTSNTIGFYLKGSSKDNTAHYNIIFNNTEYGINAANNSGYSINATNNWWGHETGPYHLVNNSEGKGDNVTDYVLFDPWLEEELSPGDNRTTWYVDDDAPDGGDGSQERPFNRIQDAINAAQEGTTIYVWNGTYYENVLVNKTLSLIGNGSGVTIINGEGKGIVVRITAKWCNVSGFNITGGGGTTWPPETEDAGIKVEANHSRIFENDCSFNKRAGIILYNSNHNVIENNIVNSNFYYGLKLDSSNNNIIENNTCSMNSKNGIQFQDSNYNTITNSIITGNKRGILVIGPSVGNEFHYNIICGNERQGIAVGTEKDFIEDGSISQYLINATLNYWGDDSGPYHPTKNSEGRGDIVTDYMDFEPWLNENGTLHQPSSHSQEDDEKFFPTPTLTAAGLVAVGSFCLIGAAYLREDLRFILLSFLTLPLYTKLGRDDILDQTNRQEIYSYLARNPGANYTRIKKELGLGTSTLVHHLNVLERERFIHSRKENARRMFYPGNFGFLDNAGKDLPLTPTQHRILDYVKESGPTTMREIEGALSLRQQSVSYNIRRLTERGLMTGSNGRRNALYRVVEEQPQSGEDRLMHIDVQEKV